MLPWLLVAVGGSIGAVLRYGVTRLADHLGYTSPYATFTVNFLGSYILAIALFGSENGGWFDDRWKLFLAVGVLGAFTTMSTFSFESIKLLDDRGFYSFIFYVAGTILLSLVAIILGKCTSSLIPG